MPDPLAPLFTPATLALAGATDAPGKMGHLVSRRILADFGGKVFLIHPNEEPVAGRPAFRDVASLPEPVDLLVALVPAKQLVALVEACPVGKVRFLLAIPSGFAEVPREGPALQRRLIEGARAKGMRLVGPNSVGLLNSLVRLNASLIPELPVGGPGLSCITQSGGFGMALYMYSQNHRLPVARLIDLGNMADVSVTEALDSLGEDETTRAVGLFLEAGGEDPAVIARAAEIARRKPVVLCRVARTAAGRRASFAHLGIVSPERTDTPPPAGVVVAETAAELLAVAKALVTQPRPKGRRAAIITGSGGIAAELVDLCVEHGLEVPALSTALQERLRPLLPSFAATQNPIDLTPVWFDYPRLYPPLLQALFASPEVDLVFATVIDVATGLPALAEAVAAAVAAGRGSKPVYVYWSSPDANIPNRRLLEAAGVPCFLTTREAARAAALAAARQEGGGP